MMRVQRKVMQNPVSREAYFKWKPTNKVYMNLEGFQMPEVLPRT